MAEKDILKTIEGELPKGVVSSTIFEGANIVVYTSDVSFLREGDSDIKEAVNKVKKRIELRGEKDILMDKENAEKEIRTIVPEDGEIENVIFDIQRSIVVIEAKRPGMVIGRNGSILKDIKSKTSRSPVLQRTSEIKSKCCALDFPIPYRKPVTIILD